MRRDSGAGCPTTSHHGAILETASISRRPEHIAGARRNDGSPVFRWLFRFARRVTRRDVLPHPTAHLTTATSTGHFAHLTTSFLCKQKYTAPDRGSQTLFPVGISRNAAYTCFFTVNVITVNNTNLCTPCTSPSPLHGAVRSIEGSHPRGFVPRRLPVERRSTGTARDSVWKRAVRSSTRRVRSVDPAHPAVHLRAG